jgi:hypothetical protein
MFIPFLLNFFPVFVDNPLDITQLGTVELVISRQSKRLKPKLRVLFRLFHMDMNGFSPFVTEKEKSVSVYDKYCRQNFLLDIVLHQQIKYNTSFILVLNFSQIERMGAQSSRRIAQSSSGLAKAIFRLIF